MGQQIVFVGNVALCEEICDEKRFRKFVGGPIVEIRRAVHDSLFTAFDNEPSWPVHHRLLVPLLTPKAIANYFTEVRDCTYELTKKWHNLRGSESSVSAIGELNRLDLETTTLCFYGRKLNGITGPEPPMIAAMNGATSEAIKRPTRPGFINWLFFSGKFNRDCAAMRKYAADCLSYRKSNPATGDPPRMLDTMINAKDDKSGKPVLDERQILDEIITMPIGSSTAPCVISSAIYYLLKNPACIEKARQEIDTVIADKFAHDQLEKLPYCSGIVRETLRLSAAAPGFNIEPIPGTQGPVLLGGGKYQVPAKQTLIVVLHGVNRDPSVFPEPEAFKPERMVGEAFEKLPEGTKKWFGNGKRVCIGKNWAWMWNMIVLVTLLKEVDFEMADPSYVLKQDGWFNLRPVGFKIKVEARTQTTSQT